jgi:hypothetical protein
VTSGLSSALPAGEAELQIDVNEQMHMISHHLDFKKNYGFDALSLQRDVFLSIAYQRHFRAQHAATSGTTPRGTCSRRRRRWSAFML